MQFLKIKRMGSASSSSIFVVITFDQTIFKRELMHVFTDRFVMNQSIKKRVCVTQCKTFTKPDKNILLGITCPIGWCSKIIFSF